MKVVGIITDFGGERDIYTGVMKAVMTKICPNISFIDITHNIMPADIKTGAFLLKSSYRYFPKGTVFLAVVDPGVGSSRDPIVIKTRHYYFVGPDNGILSLAAVDDGVCDIFVVQNKRYFMKRVSSTFHGRDIFAPVAAYICKGVNISSLGKRKSYFEQVYIEPVIIEKSVLEGRIIYKDFFGNLITNITMEQLREFTEGKDFYGVIKRKKFVGLREFYTQNEGDKPFFIEGSFGYLEVSLNKESAAEYFNIDKDEYPKVVVKKVNTRR